MDVARFVGRRERDRAAFEAGPARAADAMDVILALVRQIEIHDDLDPLDVDAARRDIRRDENPVESSLDSVQRVAALALRAVGMKLIGLVAHLIDLLRELRRPGFRAREDEDAALILLEDFIEQIDFGDLGDDVELLDDLRGRRSRRRDFDLNRHRHVESRYLDNGLRHRRRKKHRLPFLRQELGNLLNLRPETHIEHAVRLVEHDHMNVRRIECLLLEMIEESPRRRDDDLDIFFVEELPLHLHVHAADHDDRADVERIAELAQRDVDLQRELARRHENHRAAGRLENPLNHRNPERQRLARSRLRDSEHVLPGNGERNRLRLNRRRHRELHAVDDGENLGRNPQIVKSRLRGFACHRDYFFFLELLAGLLFLAGLDGFAEAIGSAFD